MSNKNESLEDFFGDDDSKENETHHPETKKANTDTQALPTSDTSFSPKNIEPLENEVADEKLAIPASMRMRQKARKATRTMTPSEYRAELNRLNKDSDNKNYIFFFGLQNSGKSYIIASILHYMSSYVDGRVELNKDKCTDEETRLYTQMIEMFSNPERNIGRTDVAKYYEISVTFTPESNQSAPTEFTFIDASGEHIESIYSGNSSGEMGSLPDYLEVILESDVNCKFAFVYDHTVNDDENQRIPQVMVLKTLYEKICAMQVKHHKYYPKILLVSKSDKIPEGSLEQYRHSPTAYVLDEKNHIRDFANGFFTEKDNRTIFYRMGVFNRLDDITKFDATCPEKLFDWFYQVTTGGTIIQQDCLCKRLKKWLLGAQ